MCDVRTTHHNHVELRQMHTRLLKLLFRPAEIGPQGFADKFGEIEYDSPEKLLPNLDTRLDNLSKPI